MSIKHKLVFLILVSLSFTSYARIIENGNASSELKELVHFLKLGKTDTLEEINEALQKNLLRSGENTLQTRHDFDSKYEQLLPRFKKLGLVDSIPLLDAKAKLVRKENFDYALLAGAFFHTMADRLNFLFETIQNQEIRVKRLFILVGQRDIDPKVENAKSMKDLETHFKWLKLPSETQIAKDLQSEELKFETGLAKYLLKYAKLPSHLKKTEILYVDSAKRKNPNGKLTRPNTADTLRDFAKLHFQGGKVLLATSQPFGEYMESIATKLFAATKKMFTLHVIASHPFNFTSLSSGVFLDYIARTVYVSRTDADKL